MTKLCTCNIYAEDLSQSLKGSLVFASVSGNPYEPRSVDSMSLSVVSLTTRSPTLLSSPSLQDFPKLCLMFDSWHLPLSC